MPATPVPLPLPQRRFEVFSALAYAVLITRTVSERAGTVDGITQTVPPLAGELFPSLAYPQPCHHRLSEQRRCLGGLPWQHAAANTLAAPDPHPPPRHQRPGGEVPGGAANALAA